jgi:hypothetical protein
MVTGAGSEPDDFKKVVPVITFHPVIPDIFYRPDMKKALRELVYRYF